MSLPTPMHHAEAAHAPLSPSAADTWMVCTRAVHMGRGTPDSTSIFAAEGSVLHLIAEWCYKLELDPYDWVGCTFEHDGYTFVIDEDHAECMVPGIDWLFQQKGDVYIEQRVHIDPRLPDLWGTLDIGVWDFENEICIIRDWKFGVGRPVSATENKQMMIYAIGFYNTFLKPKGIRPKLFRLIIDQSRCFSNNGGGEWDISFEDLMVFGEYLIERALLAQSGKGEFVPGAKQCHYCKTNRTQDGRGCRALDQYVMGLIFAMKSKENLRMQNVNGMDDDQIFRVWEHRDMIKNWLRGVESTMVNRARAGDPINETKIVLDRAGKRDYEDKESAEEVGHLVAPIIGYDVAFPRSVITPAQLETKLKPKRGKGGFPLTWAAVNEHIIQSAASEVLVTKDDPRPPIGDADDDFDEADDDDF